MLQLFFKWLKWRIYCHRLTIVKRQADKLRQLTGRRHYVIQINKSLHVFDRPRINELIRVGILKDRLRSHWEIVKIAVYYTI